MSNIINDYGLLTKADMIERGATGTLTKGFERFIKTSKVVSESKEPDTWVDDEGTRREYTRGTLILHPIEVRFDKTEDVYYLVNGKSRLKQALINMDEYILAFVEPDKGFIGSDSIIL